MNWLIHNNLTKTSDNFEVFEEIKQEPSLRVLDACAAGGSRSHSSIDRSAVAERDPVLPASWNSAHSDVVN
jgi:hypothetical protein